MLVEHQGKAPKIHSSACVAPTAVVCGAVHVEADARILFGAVLTAEDGEIRVGERTVIMENALIRGRARHFSGLLVDGDIASNAGNWQWIAGTGNDTRPGRRFSADRLVVEERDSWNHSETRRQRHE